MLSLNRIRAVVASQVKLLISQTTADFTLSWLLIYRNDIISVFFPAYTFIQQSTDGKE